MPRLKQRRVVTRLEDGTEMTYDETVLADETDAEDEDDG